MSIARKAKRAGGGRIEAEAGDDLRAGRRVHHGLGPPLCRGEAGASRQGRRLLDRQDAGDECRVPPLRQGDRPRHLRRDCARPQGLSRRAAAYAARGLARLREARRVRSISPTGRIGGPSPSAPTGGIRTGRAARSRGSTITPSCMSPIATPRPTRNGPARSCRARRSGNSPRAAGSRARSSPGAMSSSRAASASPIPGRASSRGRTCSRTVTRAPHRSAPIRPTAMASTT